MFPPSNRTRNRTRTEADNRKLPACNWAFLLIIMFGCCLLAVVFGSVFGRLVFIHLQCWEVLPFWSIQRQWCIKILCPKDPEFYTPLALNRQKGQHLPALEEYKNQSHMLYLQFQHPPLRRHTRPLSPMIFFVNFTFLFCIFRCCHEQSQHLCCVKTLWTKPWPMIQRIHKTIQRLHKPMAVTKPSNTLPQKNQLKTLTAHVLLIVGVFGLLLLCCTSKCT